MTTSLSEDLVRESARVTFHRHNHQYIVDGRTLPSVTRIIKQLHNESLEEWKIRVEREAISDAAVEIHHSLKPGRDFEWELDQKLKENYENEKIREKATKIGSEVHKLIEHWCRGEVPAEPSEQAKALFEKWQAWARTVDLEIVGVEQKLGGELYAGTIDLLAKENGQLTIFDWKTSRKPKKKLYEEQILQYEGYGQLCEERLGVFPKGKFIFIPKDGGDLTIVPAEHDQKKLVKFQLLTELWWSDK